MVKNRRAPVSALRGISRRSGAPLRLRLRRTHARHVQLRPPPRRTPHDRGAGRPRCPARRAPRVRERLRDAGRPDLRRAPCASPLLHARRTPARWANAGTRRLTAPDNGGPAPAAGRSRERLLCDSCGRRGASSPRRILGTSCSRTCGLPWSRWPPCFLVKALCEDRGLGSRIATRVWVRAILYQPARDRSVGARYRVSKFHYPVTWKGEKAWPRWLSARRNRSGESLGPRPTTAT